MGWKLLAITDCAIASWKVSLVLSAPAPTWAGCGFVALHAAVALGLVGYAWGIRIGRPFVWAIVGTMYLFTAMGTVLGATVAMTLFDDGRLADSRLGIILALAMMGTYALIKCFALSRYSQRTMMPWAKSD